MICRFCGSHTAALDKCTCCGKAHPAVTAYRTPRDAAVTDVLTALLAVPADSPKPAEAPPPPKHSPRYLLPAAAAAAVLLLVCGALLLHHTGSTQDPAPAETMPLTEALPTETQAAPSETDAPTETRSQETDAPAETDSTGIDGTYDAIGHGTYVRSRSEWYSIFRVKPAVCDKTLTIRDETLLYEDTAYPCMYRHDKLVLTDTNFAGISDDFIESFDFDGLTGSEESHRADDVGKRLYRFDLKEQNADVTLLCTLLDGLAVEENPDAVWSISDGSPNAVVLTEEEGVFVPGISYRGKITALDDATAAVLLDTDTSRIIRLSPDAKQDYYFYQDTDSTGVYLIQYIRYNRAGSGVQE